MPREPLPLPTPKDDPDTRPLLERIEGNDLQLATDLWKWVGPVLELIDDPDLHCRCSLLLGYACGRLARERGGR